MRIEQIEWLNELARILGHSIWIGTLLPLIYFFCIKSSPRFLAKQRVSRGLLLMLLIPVLSVVSAYGYRFIPATFNYTFAIPVMVVVWTSALWLLGVGGIGIRLVLGMIRVFQLKHAGKKFPLRCWRRCARFAGS